MSTATRPQARAGINKAPGLVSLTRVPGKPSQLSWRGAHAQHDALRAHAYPHPGLPA